MLKYINKNINILETIFEVREEELAFMKGQVFKDTKKQM